MWACVRACSWTHSPMLVRERAWCVHVHARTCVSVCVGVHVGVGVRVWVGVGACGCGCACYSGGHMHCRQAGAAFVQHRL